MLSDCNLMGFGKRIKRSVKLHKYTESPSPKLKPLPRAAHAASPSPYEGTEKVKSTFRLKVNDG